MKIGHDASGAEMTFSTMDGKEGRKRLIEQMKKDNYLSNLEDI